MGGWVCAMWSAENYYGGRGMIYHSTSLQILSTMLSLPETLYSSRWGESFVYVSGPHVGGGKK